jgi:hypothetical protein
MISSPRSRRPSPEEVAYHEAGHVVVGDRLGLDLVAVDIDPDGDGGNGHSVFRPPAWFESGPALDPRSREFVERVITTFLAGPVAEAKRAGFENPEGSGFDEDAIVRQWARRLGSPTDSALRLRDLGADAARLVEEPANWEAIGRLARVLLERRRLPGGEAVAIAKRGPA